MNSLILCLSLLGLALGDDPPPCCSERQFEARLAEIGGALYDKHGHQAPALINIDNVLHYDYYKKSVVYEIYEHTEQGKEIRSRIVHDFKTQNTHRHSSSGMVWNERRFQKFELDILEWTIMLDHPRTGIAVCFFHVSQQRLGSRYVIMNGTCTVSAGSRVISEQCVPDHAKFLGKTYLGYGLSSIAFNAWQYEDASSGTRVKMAMTADNCVPLVQSIFSPQADNDVVFTITNFRPGIIKANVFNLPANCVTSSDATQSIPSSVEKAQQYIDVILSR